MKILVLDNDALALRSVGRLLRSRKHEVEAAQTLQQARERLAEHTFDLALLDLELDEGQTTLPLAAELAARGLRVVFNTGSIRIDLLNEASAIGLVIHKGPGSVERLLMVLDAASSFVTLRDR